MKWNVLLVLGGRGGFLGLWFLGLLLLIRSLEPRDFGTYSLCVAVVKIVTSVWGDALDFAALRQVPLLLSTDRPQAFALLRTVFWGRGVLGVIIFAIAGVLASPLAGVFFHVPPHASLFLLVGMGILGDLLLRSLTGYFQAAEEFSRYLLLDGILQVGRFLAVLIMIATHTLTVQSALSVFAGFPFLVFLVGLLLLPKEWSWWPLPRRHDVVAIFHYSKWLVVSFIAAALYERVDVLLLGHFRTMEEVGVYSAALTLATLPDFIVGCLTTVLHPRIVHLYAAGQFAAFNRRYWSWALPIAGLVAVVALLFGDFLIRALLTARYVAAIPVFQVLVLGTLFWGAVTPVSSSLLALVVPQRIVLVTASALVLMSLLGSVLIPIFGFMGAAVLVVSVKVVIGVWLVILARRLLSQPLATTQETPLVLDYAAQQRDNVALEPYPTVEGPRL